MIIQICLFTVFKDSQMLDAFEMEGNLKELCTCTLQTSVSGYISKVPHIHTALHTLLPVSAPLLRRWLFGRLVPIGQGHFLTPQRSIDPPHIQTA